MLVVDKVLEERAAQPLHQRADHLALQRQRIDDPAGVLHHDIIDDLHLTDLRVDRHMRGLRAVAVGVLLVEKGAFPGQARERGQRQRLAVRAADLILGEPDLGGRASKPLRCFLAQCRLEIMGGIEQCRAAHHDRPGMVGAVAVAHEGGGAVIDAADPVHRDFERVGGDLREHGLHPLPDRGRADEHRDRAILVDCKPRGLLRAGGTAFDEATDRDPMVAPANELALQLRLLRPADFLKAALQRHPVVAAVVFILVLVGRNGRDWIRHFRMRDQVFAAELDPVDAQILRNDVEQPLAEEIGLEAARPAIGADRRLVGHPQRNVELDVRDAVGASHELRDVARADGAVGAHIGAHVDVGMAAQSEDRAVAFAGDLNIDLGFAGMIHRHQVLAPVLGPLDRPVEMARRKRDQEILGIEFAARAKAAADIVLDHVD